MSDAISIGEAAARVVQRTATMMAFRDMLQTCPTAENRRRVVNAAFSNGALTEDEHRAFSAEG
jgi:hypothetical protein